MNCNISRLLIPIFLILSHLSYAQEFKPSPEWQDNTHVQVYRMTQVETTPGEIRIPSKNLFTAVAVIAPSMQAFEGAYLKQNNEILWLEHDPHSDSESQLISNLESLPFGSDAPVYFFAPEGGEWEFVLVNSGTAPEIPRPSGTADAAQCDQPTAIPQSEWRSGLPAPSPGRSHANVSNLIVHHSAGSNSATNYTQVVRDIYIFHTEYRGWSDVGYNYLIAQNGALYLGRDPESGAQDEVIGAHFCGGNTGTMGVCLLGTYTNIAPTDTTLGTLTSLLSWKAFKDDLDPLATSPHRFNDNLGVIAGHRDGCDTECPGEKTYGLLQDIREAVDYRLQVCRGEIAPPPVIPQDSVLVYRLNSTTRNMRIYAAVPSRVSIQETRLIDATGRPWPARLEVWDENTWQLKLGGYPMGIYFLQMVVGGQVQTQRIMVW